MTRALALWLLCAAAGACSDGGEGGDDEVPAFPANYAESYVEVRDCRKSGDHDLNFVRMLADPRALEPYRDRAAPFPDGALLLKEEYDFADSACSGAIVQWTVMVKNQTASQRLGWDWQRVDGDRRVVESNGSRCVTCHAGCTGAPGVGYDHSCAEP